VLRERRGGPELRLIPHVGRCKDRAPPVRSISLHRSRAARRAAKSEVGVAGWCGVMERVMGIEPTLAAWEAAVLPLNYTRTEESPIEAVPIS
jgi:hypothetical protein